MKALLALLALVTISLIAAIILAASGGSSECVTGTAMDAIGGWSAIPASPGISVTAGVESHIAEAILSIK